MTPHTFPCKANTNRFARRLQQKFRITVATKSSDKEFHETVSTNSIAQTVSHNGSHDGCNKGHNTGIAFPCKANKNGLHKEFQQTVCTNRMIQCSPFRLALTNEYPTHFRTGVSRGGSGAVVGAERRLSVGTSGGWERGTNSSIKNSGSNGLHKQFDKELYETDCTNGLTKSFMKRFPRTVSTKSCMKRIAQKKS